MNSSTEEFSTPRINTEGEGDGLRNTASRRRVAVLSCRKFNVRMQRDEKLQLKLETALQDAQTRPKPKIHSCLEKKSKTVAEITPTKSKASRRPFKLTSSEDVEDTVNVVALHATPRPLDAPPPKEASRRCPRDWAVCMVYQRLLVCVWRRCRARLDAVSESCGRQQNQIHQLEVQVDFLKNLRTTEWTKRKEALEECLIMKKKTEILESDKINLMQELKNTQEELMNAKKNLKLAKCDLKKCSDQVGKLESQLKKRKEEKLDLQAKVSSQEQELLNQASTISSLGEALKMSERNLQNSETNLKTKQEQFSEILQQLQNEVDSNCSMKEEIDLLRAAKNNLENQSKCLEEELEAYISNCDELREENISLRDNFEEVSLQLQEEKKKAWYKDRREIASVSLAALQKIASIVLPVCRQY
ncbi:uncharacterized protein [Leptinotarsa decemlineata]|uniref:uncharacterized protein n=1 Tax=Leptinotarsa decemlineata TaxID=7539 RepID=UPI003D30BB1F